MNKLLVMILGIIVYAISISAGEKELTFSGNITSYNDENRIITTKNGKKEMVFFVAGDVLHGSRQLELTALKPGCFVTIFYQKNPNRLVASKIEVGECLAVNR